MAEKHHPPRVINGPGRSPPGFEWMEGYDRLRVQTNFTPGGIAPRPRAHSWPSFLLFEDVQPSKPFIRTRMTIRGLRLTPQNAHLRTTMCNDGARRLRVTDYPRLTSITSYTD